MLRFSSAQGSSRRKRLRRSSPEKEKERNSVGGQSWEKKKWISHRGPPRVDEARGEVAQLVTNRGSWATSKGEAATSRARRCSELTRSRSRRLAALKEAFLVALETALRGNYRTLIERKWSSPDCDGVEDFSRRRRSWHPRSRRIRGGVPRFFREMRQGRERVRVGRPVRLSTVAGGDGEEELALFRARRVLTRVARGF
jgi:hypothetical protein